jgi:hypothetical protein
MKPLAVLAAMPFALALAAAPARDLAPMDVMGPYDTPAAAADRIAIPDAVSDAGRQQSEVAIERVESAADPGFGVAELPGLEDDWHGKPGHDGEGHDKPEKPDDGDG